jgi:transcriptional regulator with XRE-family HTH domain
MKKFAVLKLSTISHTILQNTLPIGYFCVNKFSKTTYMATQKITLANRIQELRKQKGWSQTELASKIGVSYTQMSRYEIKGVQPPANTLKKMADVFDTTIDFMISGDKDEKVKASLKDAELLQQFKAVEQFSDDDKTVVKKLIDAFIVKKQLQLMAS